jgi:hypothetical protein
VVDELNVAGYVKTAPNEFFGAMSFGVPAPDNPTGTTRADLVIGKKNMVEMNSAARFHFDWVYHALKMEIGIK